MRKSAFLLAMLFATQVHAATPRCAKDDFGNVVCMDKDGVVSVAPRDRAGEAQGKAAASAVSPNGDAGDRNHDRKAPQRCAVDSFGNTVCSQYFNNKKEK